MYRRQDADRAAADSAKGRDRESSALRDARDAAAAQVEQWRGDCVAAQAEAQQATAQAARLPRWPLYTSDAADEKRG